MYLFHVLFAALMAVFSSHGVHAMDTAGGGWTTVVHSHPTPNDTAGGGWTSPTGTTTAG